MLARARRLHREARDILIAKLISSGEMIAEVRYLTVMEAAEEMHVSPGAIYTWLREKRFEGAVQIVGRQWAIPAALGSPPTLLPARVIDDTSSESPQPL